MAKAKTVQITKITLRTKDGKEVELSLEEAKELHGQLDELFGHRAVYIPSQPIVIRERDRWPWWSPWKPMWTQAEVTCKGDSGLTVSYSGGTTSQHTADERSS